ncbi:MAG: ABC transporter ATP-binding protein [Acidimicrobiaceae bacterium]|nr:ABC transporter ATP-binding protein [Acidimicrobiaceae bacterium]MCY4295235.1 ABC transporter ATP-binding protein [Acidimicrobiaceae bacterium]
MASPGINPDRSLGWLRRILPVASRYRVAFAAATAAGLVSVAATAAAPVVIGRGVDAAAAGEALRPWVISLLVLAGLRFGLGYAYRYGLFRSAHCLEADLRKLVYEHLVELSFSYWDRTQTGQVISRANSDIRSIQLLFAFAPLMATQLALLVMGAAAMLALSLPLTLVAMAPLPLVLYVGIRLRNQVFPLSWVTQARTADVAMITDESIQGAQVVRNFAQEQAQVQLLAGAAQRLRWAGIATADARARHSPVMEALPRLGLALVLGTGGLLAIDGSVAVGDIVAFNAYVLLMAAPFRMIGFVLIQWQRASAAAQRVFEILDEEPEIVDKPEALPLPSPEGLVEFDDVTFAYASAASAGDGGGGSARSGTIDRGGKNEPGDPADSDDAAGAAAAVAIIDGFSLTVEPGETVAVVGRTGSGKSTLGRLLARFYDVASGAVRIDGIDVRDLRVADLRRAVTVVSDDPFLFAASVRDNVAFARPEADEESVTAALADSAAGGFVEALPEGADTVLGERGSTISGGQRQRLAIARALLADAAVLVLDDATSAIDIAVEERILSALRRRRGRRSTILIAHRLSTLALADRVVLIADGKTAACGSHDDLLRTVPAYAEVLAHLQQAQQQDAQTGAETRRAPQPQAAAG